eukprot:5368797-Pleurochrysis_carterae.AAC.2
MAKDGCKQCGARPTKPWTCSPRQQKNSEQAESQLQPIDIYARASMQARTTEAELGERLVLLQCSKQQHDAFTEEHIACDEERAVSYTHLTLPTILLV